MNCRILVASVVTLALTLAAGARAAGPSEAAKAPLFDDLGHHHWPVTTKSELAQRYFDQGLILAYGFNHAEALRSFEAAGALDPDCAMAWWGAAYVLGPNINAPMDSSVVDDAWAFTRKALAAAAKTTPKEKALAEALARRYAENPPADRKALDIAYANAMREVAGRFPDDLDMTALLAEALMDLTPWQYWTKDGEPGVYTKEIVASIEKVLAANPSHPGAIHFYIHAMEASRDAGKAEKAADRLAALVPGSGHLVHMPSHTYIRIGRYKDAVDSNTEAIRADDSYLEQCHAQGVYPLAYVPHNHHFRYAGACMAGMSAVALEAGRTTDERTAHELMREPGLGTLQHYSMMPLYALVRFGRWEEVLKYPAPAADLKYPAGVRHWARGMALNAGGKTREAAAELAALERIAALDTLEKVTIWDINTTRSLVRIAVEVLAGEMAARGGDFDTAVKRLREGVRIEDGLRYNEPADWAYPVSHNLGAVLLAAGRPAEAEAVYLEDLRQNPENGWSLFGLAQSLEAQQKTGDAAKVRQRLAKAWAHADVQLTASRF